MKNSSSIAVAVAVAVVSAAGTAWMMQRYQSVTTKAVIQLASARAVAHYGKFVELAYCSGNPDTARQSIMEWLEALKDFETDPLLGDSIKIDSSLAYMRLASFAEGQEKEELEKKGMEAYRSAFPQKPAPDLSALVKIMDAQACNSR